MANTIALQTLEDGHRNLVVKINITGDGSGDETAALVVDVSSYTPPATSVSIQSVTYALEGFSAALNWDATTDKLALVMNSTAPMTDDFTKHGGLINDAGAGKTGDIMLATTGLGSGEKGTIVLTMRKKGT